jgi:uridine kinase
LRVAETYLIGVAGPSGAGKTYLAQHLARFLNAPVLSTDAYYRDLSHLPWAERALCNFDEPGAMDPERLVEHVRQLKAGAAVEIPCYDFTNHVSRPETVSFRPADIVIVEGLFVLYWPELLELLRTKVYVEMDERACLERRALRDIQERGRTRESVEHQYRTTVAPMTELYVRPTRVHADVVVRGNTSPQEAVEAVVNHMNRQLGEARS